MDIEADDRPLAAVAVVASAGGVEALTGFVRALPADFPAAVLVVLHMSETGPSVLPHVLARVSALEVAHASTSEPLRRGHIVVGPPGRHLRVRDGVAELDSGPRENMHRPSADALLRSVADSWGPRAAGIVLSGTMDDGAAGLHALAIANGFTVVQDPDEASFPGMPRAAIAAAHPAVICRVQEMAAHLTTWIDSLNGMPTIHRHLPPEAETGLSTSAPPSELTCPECGGSLWPDPSYGIERYRCRVGHSFSLESLLNGKQDAVEAALWAAIVALEERIAVLRRLVDRLERLGGTARRYRTEIETARQRIETLRLLVGELESQHVADSLSVQGAQSVVALEKERDDPEPAR